MTASLGAVPLRAGLQESADEAISRIWTRCEKKRATCRFRGASFVVQIESRFKPVESPSGSPAPPKPNGVMMLMLPKGYEKAAPGAMPDAKAGAAMMKYNESLQKAGVLLALDGCHRWVRASRSPVASPR